MMIGKRTLSISGGRSTETVDIVVSSPEPDGERWVCSYSIGWPTGPQTRRVHGVDGIAAVHSALMMIGLDVNGSVYHQQGRLHWMEPFVGLGFPVPKAARDLLTGEDAELFG